MKREDRVLMATFRATSTFILCKSGTGGGLATSLYGHSLHSNFQQLTFSDSRYIFVTMAARYLLLGAVAAGSAAASSVACSANVPLSCHNTTAVDTCCFNYPGGHLLQTQFWDTNPATGPSDSWTIHGLWYDQNPPFPGRGEFEFANQEVGQIAVSTTSIVSHTH